VAANVITAYLRKQWPKFSKEELDAAAASSGLPTQPEVQPLSEPSGAALGPEVQPLEPHSGQSLETQPDLVENPSGPISVAAHIEHQADAPGLDLQPQVIEPSPSSPEFSKPVVLVRAPFIYLCCCHAGLKTALAHCGENTCALCLF
jgi:hypothetical protein